MIKPRVINIDLHWPGVAEIAPIVKNWADIIYVDGKFAGEPDGVDFFLNKDFEKINSGDDLIATRWGKNPDDSFYCVSGNGLYELIPWWKKMQNFFESELGLTPWLPYPCLLISQSNLRRHVDLGRPTAFNYPIFGEKVCTNYIWHTQGAPASKYDETYSYEHGKTIILDTSYEHGGFVNPGYEFSSTRAICNMGFAEPYEVCVGKILEAIDSGRINKLYE